MPSFCSAMARRPALTCSPDATMASYSRGSCNSFASRAQATAGAVSPPSVGDMHEAHGHLLQDTYYLKTMGVRGSYTPLHIMWLAVGNWAAEIKEATG